MAAKRDYRACTNMQAENYLGVVRTLLHRYMAIPAPIDREIAIHALTKPDDIDVCRKASDMYGVRHARKYICVSVPYFVEGGIVAEHDFKFQLSTGTFRLPDYVEEMVVDKRNSYYADFRAAVDPQVHAYLNVIGVYDEIRRTLKTCVANVARALLPDFKALYPGDAASDWYVPEPLLRWRDICATAKMMKGDHSVDVDEATAVLAIGHSSTDTIIGGV